MKSFAVLVVTIVLSISNIGLAQFDEECYYECEATYCHFFGYDCEYECYEVCYPYRHYSTGSEVRDKLEVNHANHDHVHVLSAESMSQTRHLGSLSSPNVNNAFRTRGHTGKVVHMKIRNTWQPPSGGKLSTRGMMPRGLALIQTCLSSANRGGTKTNNFGGVKQQRESWPKIEEESSH